MTDNLYEVLGVEPGASKDQIKAAYRAAARKHHPDAGGSAEHFMAVTRSYDVLMNDELRATYDADGTVDDGDVRKQRDRVMGILSECLDVVIEQIDGNVSENDVVRMMKRIISTGVENLDKQIKNFEKQVASLSEINRRIKREEESKNTFSEVIMGKINAANAKLNDIRKERALGAMALSSLEGHSSIVDAVREFQAGTFFAHTGRVQFFEWPT